MFISINHLTKDFPRKPRALDDVTCDLPHGMVGLIGPKIGRASCRERV